jgi:hypothetical protein
VLAGTIAAALTGPARERAAWGTARTVLVADHDVAAGAPIAAHAEQVPAVMAPRAALVELADDDRAASTIRAGEILVDADVAGNGPWALMPDGWRAIAVARQDASLDVRPGDRVDVHCSSGELATGALVIAATDVSITVAVTAGDAPAVAAAATDRTLVLALVSGSP